MSFYTRQISDFSGINDILVVTGSIGQVEGVVYGRDGTGTSNGFALALAVIAGLSPPPTQTHLQRIINIILARWLCVLDISAMTTNVAEALLVMLQKGPTSTLHQ